MEPFACAGAREKEYVDAQADNGGDNRQSSPHAGYGHSLGTGIDSLSSGAQALTDLAKCTRMRLPPPVTCRAARGANSALGEKRDSLK